MKRYLIIASILLCQISNVFGRDVRIEGFIDPARNIEKLYIVDTDHMLNTPSWVADDPCPLGQEKLLILLHRKYPKLTNESICSIKISKFPNTGNPDIFKYKWFYTVAWRSEDSQAEMMVVLLDGTIIEPRIKPYK
jgi:hypothetical protein